MAIVVPRKNHWIFSLSLSQSTLCISTCFCCQVGRSESIERRYWRPQIYSKNNKEAHTTSFIYFSFLLLLLFFSFSGFQRRNRDRLCAKERGFRSSIIWLSGFCCYYCMAKAESTLWVKKAGSIPVLLSIDCIVTILVISIGRRVECRSLGLFSSYSFCFSRIHTCPIQMDEIE